MSDKNASKDGQAGRLTRGGLAAFAVKMLSVGLGYAAQLILARALGTKGYGELIFAVVTLNFLSIGSLAGADSVATRFISLFRDNRRMAKRCLRWLNRRTALLATVTLALALIVLQFVYQFDSRAIWIVTQVVCLSLPFQVFSNLRQGILQGLELPALSQIPELLVRPLVTMGLVGMVFLLHPFGETGFKSVHAAWVVVAGVAVVWAVGHITLIRSLPRSVDDHTADSADDSNSIDLEEEARDYFVQWRSMAWAGTFASIASTLHAQCDVWMLGVMVESEQVGPYAIAARYASFVVFGINAVNSALGPLVATSVDDRSRLQELASRAALLSFILGSGVGLLLICFPAFLLSLFGDGFDQSANVLVLLVVGNLINILCGSVGMLLNMSGHHKDFMKVILGSVGINLVLNLILIPYFGTMGAAAATTISTVCWNICGLVLVRNKLKIHPTLGGWI